MTDKTALDILIDSARQSLAKKEEELSHGWMDTTKPRLIRVNIKVTPAQIDACEKELAALRQRAEDLDLIARAALRHEFCRPIGGAVGRCDWELHPIGSTIYGLKDDGTGFPILTDEIRAALRGLDKKGA